MFPETRLRRLRQRRLQPLFRESELRATDLVAPLFIDETLREPLPISSMPGQSRIPLHGIAAVASRLYDAGIRAVILFGIPEKKDPSASSAFDADGVTQNAVRLIRSAVPGMVIMTDVCACEYTDHGHCGIITEERDGPDLDNDSSLTLMAKIAVSHAEAGADCVAPSCMLDGQVKTIRAALDEKNFQKTPILSYSTKFSSALYGPFREAADSCYSCGDRTTYQMDPANAREAFRESKLDSEEGADILMVKPAGLYLDILKEIRTLGLPVAAYQVSGEYAMIKSAAMNGWIDEKNVVLESLICIKRAGADLIITYFAEDAARWLHEK
ncbi:MAG: Delta-aminolevulinic acid dehydratase [Methanomicrobiales archaeon 53_19]|uniref:porphobilinogen synthase n=1 Tax=Methanocalculus sp. TaxID=2004547 RepID=UPI000748818B|nr:porphobilinogen synthase [Methanocalculus sp.]KUK71211.1 MAG: Delta-aminolevulinic acid dehydratase [Methanocalculus sp. 52_23]KUL04754.1 MAG: Delta-aminolevulinic acid dehydratase [Methanomicrobiales archaeon 53_19]HIJ06970.1 porphobilinogen synthase [Methanocalculus sp.]